MNVLELYAQLDDYDPEWRENISPDPVEAGVELGLLEPEVLDGIEELDFNED